ncbi:hypothetical protein VTN77DRAFT_4565 [Rasamsonia byssochlamydoides]|uniref:uncharacterized protein n=1 Tax=Rasamsonia byssochlamydoides TaxID=89139 RepID=UPI0037447A83
MALRDPSAIHSQLHRRKNAQKDTVNLSESSQHGSPRKRASIAALSSLVRDSVTWAGEALSAYRDGLSKEERERKLRLDDRKQILYMKMRNAVSFDEWRSCACELDELEGNNAWKETFESDEYSPQIVWEHMKQLEDARISCDISRMVFLVRTALSRDLGGMGNSSLYQHAHVGTKNLIDQYINTALDTISTIVDLSGSNRCDLSEMRYILDQLLLARQAFGRSAMLFSGGATFGMCHIGVLKALWEARLVPRIVSGASAGSIVAAVFCAHTDDELPEVLDRFAYGDRAVFEPEGHQESALQKAARFLKYGSFYDICHLERVMRNWLGDMTFQEAYNRTRRILNICISSAGLYELPRLLNYITAPNVLIWSAVAVSCSVPVVFSPSVLMAKDPLTGEAVPWHDDRRQWIDGSVDGDVPMTRLAEMFNVNHFIVSQVNPHIVPFLEKEDGPGNDSSRRSWLSSPWLHTLTSLAREEALHRITTMSELGIFPNGFTKAASILSQKYSGDINIFPEIPYTHVPRMLKNPTTEFMLQACLSGERATWPKIARIRNHVAIELALDSAVQTMRARVALNPGPVAGLGIQRSRKLPRRRSSYSHESDRRRATSNRRPSIPLRKACSTLSMECVQLEPQPSPVVRQSTDQSQPPADSSFSVISDSEDETGVSPVTRRPLPLHSATWTPSLTRPTSPRSSRASPVRSRRPSAAKVIALPARPHALDPGSPTYPCPN